MRNLFLIFGAAVLSFGQSKYSAEGRLINGETDGGDLSVEVLEMGGRMRFGAVPVHSDSTFRIEVPSDQRALEFRVLNRRGDVIQTFHEWPLRGKPIELRLHKKKAVPAGGGISAKRLAFKPSQKMQRSFEKAHKLSATGKRKEALAAWQEIVNAEPEWFEALVELGVQQTTLGEHQPAVDSFQRALAIDSNVPEVYPLLGVALVRSGQFPEAMQIAQKGLTMNPDCHRTKFVLGLAMAARKETSDGAVPLLDEVQSYHPEAMVPLAALLLRAGNFAASRDTAWRYLHMAKTPRSELASKIWHEASLRVQAR